MLVTFKTTARYPDITMFGDVAMNLIRLMGRNDSLPGAIEPEDIPNALTGLQKGIADAAAVEEPVETVRKDGDDEAPVSLQDRAVPLIELLTAAQIEKVSVMWEEGARKY